MFGSRNKAKGTTVVAKEAQFEGSLELAGSAHVEGAFKGTLTAGTQLSVGPDGAVEGTLTAEVMIIAGRVQGTVAARRLHILSSGRVEGNVFYQALQVDRGGTIAGQVHQGEHQQAHAEDSEDHREQAEESGISPAAPHLADEHQRLDAAQGQ
jgi:cytoskeletal protein CcmA (bactofilin family)